MDLVKIGKHIADKRKALGLTQKQLATQIDEMTPIQYDTEQGMAAFIYGKEGISGFAIEDVTNEAYISDNDYVYYFSVEFDRK